MCVPIFVSYEHRAHLSLPSLFCSGDRMETCRGRTEVCNLPTSMSLPGWTHVCDWPDREGPASRLRGVWHMPCASHPWTLLGFLFPCTHPPPDFYAVYSHLHSHPHTLHSHTPTPTLTSPHSHTPHLHILTLPRPLILQMFLFPNCRSQRQIELENDPDKLTSVLKQILYQVKVSKWALVSRLQEDLFPPVSNPPLPRSTRAPGLSWKQ